MSFELWVRWMVTVDVPASRRWMRKGRSARESWSAVKGKAWPTGEEFVCYSVVEDQSLVLMSWVYSPARAEYSSTRARVRCHRPDHSRCLRTRVPADHPVINLHSASLASTQHERSVAFGSEMLDPRHRHSGQSAKARCPQFCSLQYSCPGCLWESDWPLPDLRL